MKTYILSYSFNGVDHTAEVENVGSCLDSLCMAGNIGSVEHVTITAK